MKNSKKMKEGSSIPSPPAVVHATTVVEPVLPPLPPHPSVFEEGEAVIANHKGYFYLAKVEKVEFNKDWQYLIHYIGWNKSWDEWLGIDDVLKQTAENLKKVSHDTKKTTDKFAKVGHVSQIKLDASFGSSKKKLKSNSVSMKRKTEHSGIKEKDKNLVAKLFNIYIPHTLKKQLIDDFEFVNQMDKLVRLPRTPNVDTIIEKYRDYRGKKDTVTCQSVGDVLNGLCVYFNKALPVLLLYNKERQQHQEAIVENLDCPSPSAVYGAEHLLRLFVKLPALLYELNIEEATLRELQLNLQDFLKFLQKNQSLFFLSNYHLPEDSQRSTIMDHD